MLRLRLVVVSLVPASRFAFQALRFRVWGLGCSRSGFRVQGPGFGV